MELLVAHVRVVDGVEYYWNGHLPAVTYVTKLCDICDNGRGSGYFRAGAAAG